MDVTVKELVDGLVAKGKAYSAIATVLVALDHVESKTEADKVLAEYGLSKTKRGITDQMHDYIAAEERTKEELETWIKQNGTPNTLRWIATHEKVRQLVNLVRSNTLAAALTMGSEEETADIIELAPTNIQDVEAQVEAFDKLPKRSRAA